MARLLFNSWQPEGAALLHVLGAAKAFLSDFTTGHGFIPGETHDDSGLPWLPEAARVRSALEGLAGFADRLTLGSLAAIQPGELVTGLREAREAFASLGSYVFADALAAAPDLEFATCELAAGRARRLDDGDIVATGRHAA